MKRVELVEWLDGHLLGSHARDSAINGLQVEGLEEVDHLVIAVDACQYTIDKAAELGAQMMFVHHGLFWGRESALVGPHGKRVRALNLAGINLYAAHLPLDSHPTMGNNSELARLLGLTDIQPFGAYSGEAVGASGTSEPISRDALAAKISELLNFEVQVLPFGPDQIQRISVVSGGGSQSIGEAIEGGFDLFITGEAPHYAYFDAEEGGMNVFLAGHYATETFGVKAFGRGIADTFGIKVTFVDHPTGL